MTTATSARTPQALNKLMFVKLMPLLIIAYILTQLFFGFGGRVPYNRALSAVIGFLNETVQPYLNLFRRFIPPLGMFDLSPIVGIILLQVVGGLVTSLLRH